MFTSNSFTKQLYFPVQLAKPFRISLNCEHGKFGIWDPQIKSRVKY